MSALRLGVGLPSKAADNAAASAGASIGQSRDGKSLVGSDVRKNGGKMSRFQFESALSELKIPISALELEEVLQDAQKLK